MVPVSQVLPVSEHRKDERIVLSDLSALLYGYKRVRDQTDRLCMNLQPEDLVVQTMTDVSPTKWHLAHTSWYFEAFLLLPFLKKYRPFNEKFLYLFNSYYNSLGPQFPRPQRGLLSRPTVREISKYRQFVDRAMEDLLPTLERHPDRKKILGLLSLGLNHEQQHQELILTDIKNVFAFNPLRPSFSSSPLQKETEAAPLKWVRFEKGLQFLGFSGEGFSYDNETPRHQVYLSAFELASRPVTNGEFFNFMTEGGYQNPDLWLSDGWFLVKKEKWEAPLYWEKQGKDWWMMTLNGMQRVDPNETLCHVSFHEAYAFSRWAQARLPTEAEWELAALSNPNQGNFLESERFHPQVAQNQPSRSLLQMFGDVWEWTRSPYGPYPGYRPASGALGEYNGKFMANQFVLRGGSCATPRTHIRPTYRNFFYPEARWQFSGIRLARDLEGGHSHP